MPQPQYAQVVASLRSLSVPTAGTKLRIGFPDTLRVLSSRTPPATPGVLSDACVRCFPDNGRLQHFRQVGRTPWCNEAETGSLALGLATSLSGGYQPPSSATRADRPVSRALSPPHAGAQLHVERTINMCNASQLHRTRRHSRLDRKARNFSIGCYSDG